MTSITITRPNRLAEDETLTSFEDWKNNLNFYLSQENNFKKFLKSDTVWTKASAGPAHRGLPSAEEYQHLLHFLGAIAGLCPPLLYNDITDETTIVSDVFKLLRSYYQFAPSESTFIKFVSIKREVKNGTLERPLHLYLRLRQFIRDNLLLSSGKIEHDGAVPNNDEHDGAVPNNDEVFSATTESLIVLRWLEILHPGLPNHISNVFAQDLQTKSLKDLQPRINEQIEDLLFRVHNNSDDSSVDLSYTRFSGNNRQFNNPRNSYTKNNHESRYSSYKYYENRNSDKFPVAKNKYYENRNSDKFPVTKNKYHENRNSDKFPDTSFRTKPKTCAACRSVKEPFIGHDIYSCSNIAPADRPTLLKSFALNVDEVSAEDDNQVNKEYDNLQEDVSDNNTHILS